MESDSCSDPLGWTWIFVQRGVGTDLTGLECLGDPLAPIPPSLKGKKDSHLLAPVTGTATPPPQTLVCKTEPGGEMKGWLANHSEDSFAKAKRGQQGPPLTPAEGISFCRPPSCWKPWSLELGGTYWLQVYPVATSVFSSVQWE